MIAEGNGNDTLAVMLGNGDGTFQPAVRYPLNITGTYIRTADVNGDGNPDVIVGALDSGGIAVYLGVGGGNLSGQRFSGLQSGPGPSHPDNYIPDLPTVFAVGDYDQDGILDIAYAGPGGAWVLRGIGNGQFVAVQPLLFQVVIPGLIPSAIYATAAAFVDADGDGLLDVVVTDNLGEARVYRNQGDGTFSTEPISSFALGGDTGRYRYRGRQRRRASRHFDGQSILSVQFGGESALRTDSCKYPIGSLRRRSRRIFGRPHVSRRNIDGIPCRRRRESRRLPRCSLR